MFSTECFHQNVNKMFKGMHPKLIFCCSQHWRWNRCTFENEANIVLLAFCNAMFDCFISSSKLQYNIWLFHYLIVTKALKLCNALFDCFISSSILQSMQYLISDIYILVTGWSGKTKYSEDNVLWKSESLNLWVDYWWFLNTGKGEKASGRKGVKIVTTRGGYRGSIWRKYVN